MAGHKEPEFATTWSVHVGTAKWEEDPVMVKFTKGSCLRDRCRFQTRHASAQLGTQLSCKHICSNTNNIHVHKGFTHVQLSNGFWIVQQYIIESFQQVRGFSHGSQRYTDDRSPKSSANPKRHSTSEVIWLVFATQEMSSAGSFQNQFWEQLFSAVKVRKWRSFLEWNMRVRAALACNCRLAQLITIASSKCVCCNCCVSNSLMCWTITGGSTL